MQFEIKLECAVQASSIVDFNFLHNYHSGTGTVFFSDGASNIKYRCLFNRSGG